MAKMIPAYREEVKQRIIETGIAVMIQKGYSRTTLDDIASELKVTKPALYRYFKSKDELILASARYVYRNYRKSSAVGASAPCPVEAWALLYDQFISTDPAVHALFFELAAISFHQEDLRSHSASVMQESLAVLEADTIAYQERGRIDRLVNPHSLAIAVIAHFQGCRFQILCGMDPQDLRQESIRIIRKIYGISDENNHCSPECQLFSQCTGFVRDRE